MKDFETAFANFIDGEEYKKGEETLFSIVRAAFVSGWLAASADDVLMTQQDAAAESPVTNEG